MIDSAILLVPEAATRGALKKKMLLKISKISLESTVLEPLFNKAADLQARKFIQKRLQNMGFSVKFTKFLRTPILRNI